jgi:hypothetical protein
MKHIVNWKFFILFFIVAGGLYLITDSFWMSLGIILLLFVADHFIAEYEDRRKRK